jgi:hypothetical protein
MASRYLFAWAWRRSHHLQVRVSNGVVSSWSLTAPPPLSEICTRIAASGKIVLAMEHRDGTSPVVVDSRGDPKLYIREEEPV